MAAVINLLLITSDI